MAHQKINNVLTLFLVVILFFGCKKESKEYTTVEWVVTNPANDAPYVNMLVRLYEAKATNNGIEYELIYEGKTNNQGRAKYIFKAALSGKYWYKPEINEGSLGVGGIDYKIIKQPSPSVENVKKDEENEVRYEIVPYAYLKQIIKNVNCEGEGDILNMHMFLKNVETGIDQEYIREGCYEFETTGSLDGSPDGYRRVYMGTYIYDYEVIRQSGTTYGSDTITLNDGEMGTIEVLY